MYTRNNFPERGLSLEGGNPLEGKIYLTRGGGGGGGEGGHLGIWVAHTFVIKIKKYP